MRQATYILATLIAATPLWAAATAEPSKEQAEFFNKKVEPLLKQACYKCHALSENKVKGGLALDAREALAKGGDTGKAVEPGKPEKSLLIKAITYEDADLQMPPKGEKLTDAQIAILTEWVKMGAPDPRKDAPKATKLTGLTDMAKGHWAYRPVTKPTVPAVRNRAWCVTPVDAFVLAKLEEKNMTPSTPATKEALLRRATYDLTGLPPTPQEINEFLADPAPNAFEKVVDRLLASPRYGERWGRYWLDTARYADTIGGDRNLNQGREDYRYPYAWTYRDWVINAFNADLPYDQMILQQLAADKIPNNPKSNLAALGFLTVGERFDNNNDLINDRIDVVTKGFLAMTVSCARCHDHMFDPITMKDYYALHGIFNSSTEAGEKPLLKDTNEAQLKDFETKVAAIEAENRTEFFKVVMDRSRLFREKPAAYILAAHYSRDNGNPQKIEKREALIEKEKLDAVLVNFLRGKMNPGSPVFGPMFVFAELPDGDYDFLGERKAKEIAANKGNRWNPIVARAFEGLKPTQFEDVFQIYEKVYAGMSSEKAKELFKGLMEHKKSAPVSFNMSEAELAATPFRVRPAGELDTEGVRNMVGDWPVQIAGRANFKFAAINELMLTHPGVPVRAMAIKDRDKASNSRIMVRGQAGVLGDEVPRRFIEILCDATPEVFKQGSGRYELAQAIASKKNPLTARVMVNRVWMHHFGEGFVRTPDDLGNQAEKPSHPELLEYLSSYFMDQGWSLKKLHKLMMLSRVYQISSSPPTLSQYAVVDPENRLLWRANVRRLDFESTRDSLLVMSRQIDFADKQVGVDPVSKRPAFSPAGGQPVNLTDEPYSFRRSIYGYIDRGNVPELMQHFDFADPDMTNSKRTSTIVPQQALFLMNSPMSVEVARRIVKHPEFLAKSDDNGRIISLYRIILSRQPTPMEIQLAMKFIKDEAAQQSQVEATSKEIVEKGRKNVARVQERRMQGGGRNDGLRAIQNEGSFVERKALTPWETFAHTILFCNEAVYVN